uniref:Putative lipocalin-2 1 n=1 Tax=Ixodes ricinus TaxID=34613 RepID=V5HFE5_IXORI
MELVSCSILFCILVRLVNAKEGAIQIDEYPDYWEHQDIGRALNNSDKTSWLIYRTYSRDNGGSRHLCVYATVTKMGNPYTFEQGYIISRWKKKMKRGKTTYVNSQYLTKKTNVIHTRTKSVHMTIAMRVSSPEGKTGGKEYRLVYSDYKQCDILRVLDSVNGRDCELYIHDQVPNLTVPRECEAVYGNACGKSEERFKQQVSDKSCRNKSEDTTSPPPIITPPERRTAGRENYHINTNLLDADMPHSLCVMMHLKIKISHIC